MLQVKLTGVSRDSTKLTPHKAYKQAKTSKVRFIFYRLFNATFSSAHCRWEEEYYWRNFKFTVIREC